MKNKKLIIIIILIVILGGICTYLYFNYQNNTTLNATSITYKEDDTIDFSSYATKNINLDDVTSKYTITAKGVYHFTGTLKGYIEVNTTENVEIILDNVTITNSTGPCIYVISSKNTYIKLIGESTLTDGSKYDVTDDDVNATVFSKDDLYFTGDGTLNVNANYADGIVSKDDLTIISGTFNINSADDGIRGKDSVVISSGTFNITAKGDGIKSTNDTDSTKGYILIKNGTFTINATTDGIQAQTNLQIDNGTFDIITGTNNTDSSSSSKGLKAGNGITINNINLKVNSLDDAIHSNNIITINNGEIELSCGDDAIHADSTIIINDGTININKSYEGIEANKITINDGTINLTSSDDGINANGGDSNAGPGNSTSNTDNKDIYLKIAGGSITVNAGGDGIDSNGSIYMSGGNVIVNGPTDNGNGAIDYNNTFVVTGGTLFAGGSSGMAQNISSTSTQYGVIIYLGSESSGTKVSIDGIGTYTSTKTFSSLVITSPNFEKGKTYTIKVNDKEYTTFTISDTLTTVGTNTSSMGGTNGGPGRR
jgi:hypothetical protein